jgi:ABC-type dipeptide/oligopeptide/nickel transport system ATPase component
METGTAAQVSGASAHPYTHMLHQASPVPDPAAQRRRHSDINNTGTNNTDTTGTNTTGTNNADADDAAGAARASGARPPGAERCNFAARCPFAVDRCWSERPALRAAAGAGEVACHRFPGWRADIAGETGAGPALALPSQRVVPVSVAVRPAPSAPQASSSPAERALHGEDQ